MGRLISFEKSVGGVVFREQSGEILYLLLQYRSWQWDFPKGHGEKGETEEQTLRREIMEETAISQVKIISGFHKSVYYFYQAKGREKRKRMESRRGVNIFKRVVYYLVETDVAEVKIDFENKDFAWLNFEEAYKRIGNDDSRRILKIANQKISSRKK